MELERVGTGCKEISTKFVGIYLDDCLSWKEHIRMTMSKINSNIFLLSSNKKLLPFQVKTMIYNSLIKCHLEYGIELWGGGHTKKLETMQKRAIRHCYNASYTAHTNSMFIRMRTFKLKNIYEYKLARLIYKHHTKSGPSEISNLFQKTCQHLP